MVDNRQDMPVELGLLEILYRNDTKIFLHSMNVARTTVQLSRILGNSDKETYRLFQAALFHDLGRLCLHKFVLYDGLNDNEVGDIYEFNDKTRESKDPRRDITIYDLINYRANKLGTHDENQLVGELQDHLHRSVYDYIMDHEVKTRRILESVGFNPYIVEVAANHHNYDNVVSPVVRRGAKIVEIADKYNAMIQSEGERPYTEALTREEAIDLIEKDRENDRDIIGALRNVTEQEEYREGLFNSLVLFLCADAFANKARLYH